MRAFKTSVIFAVAALAATAAAAQSSEYVRQLANQLAQLRDQYVPSGYRLIMGPETDSLGRGGTDRYSVTLTSGRSYKLVGVCDNDCTDLDIRLFDQNNNLIDEDTLTDDKPVVSVTPRWTGPFRMEVVMASCSTQPCFYQIAVYGN